MKWGDASHEVNFPRVGSSHCLPGWAENGLAERQQRVLDHVNSFHGFIDDEINSLSSELGNSNGADPEIIQKKMLLKKLQRLRVPLGKFTVKDTVHSNVKLMLAHGMAAGARRVHETKKRPLYREAGESVNPFDYSYSPR
eukprot:565018-Rhodomonas_salina.1